jgi:hypothetical protein
VYGTTFDVTPAAREGVPWLWDQLRSHGYATGIGFEGCWNSEVEDFFGSYPYGTLTYFDYNSSPLVVAHRFDTLFPLRVKI